MNLVGSQIAWKMCVGTSRRKSSWDADDDAVTGGKLAGKVDLVPKAVFGQFHVGNGVTDFNLEDRVSKIGVYEADLRTMIAGVEWNDRE